MAYGLPKFEARITIPTGGLEIAATDAGGGPVTITIPPGYYYPSTLLSALVALLNANGTLTATYTGTIDDDATASTGRVTIAASGTFSITWTSTVIRDHLGFTGNLSAAATYQSTNAAKLLFLPDVPRAFQLVPDGHAGRPVANQSFTSAPTGHTVVLDYGDGRVVDNLEFATMIGRKVWTQYETYGNESFESLWRNAIKPGAPLRYHYDRSVDGTYVTYRVVAPAMFVAEPIIPSFVGGPASASDGASLRWHVGPYQLVGYVE